MSGQSVIKFSAVRSDAPSSPPSATGSFDAYALAGFGTDLLPILPHDATISPQSPSFDELIKNRGKVPGEKRHGGWVGKANFTDSVATADDHRRWQAWGAGVGMLGRNFPALDIDIDDADLADIVHELAFSVLGAAPVRFGNGSRRILVFRGANFTKRRITFRDCNAPPVPPGEKATLQAVEFLAKGQQYVVEGIHPKTMKPYYWVDGRSPVEVRPEGLTEITADGLDRFFTQLERRLGQLDYEVVTQSSSGSHAVSVYQPGLRAPSLEAIGRALCAIPNEVDYDTWLKIGIACKAAAGLEHEAAAFALYEDWSLDYPENTPEIVLAKWESFRPPYKIGWDFLARFAQDEGDGSFVSAHEDFEAIADAPEPGAKSGTMLSEPLQRMFDRYVWVERLKRVCDTKSGDLLDREQFNVRMAHIGDPSDAKKCGWAAMLRDFRNVTAVKGVTYRPGKGLYVDEELPGLTGKCVNTWTDPGLVLPPPPTDEAVRPWLEHVAFCVPDEQERETVLSWLAWVAQHPGEKPNWALVIGSTVEGLGKDLMMDPVREALGPANVREIGPEDLGSGYSDYLVGTRLLIVEEMELNERKATMNRLKPLIAAPPYTLRVNVKFQPQYEVPNIIAAVFFTNMENALAINRQARRYFVTWNDAQPRDASYYEGLVDWYASGGALKAASWLMHRDVSEFKAKGRAPDTAAKENMRLETRSLLDELIEDGLADGEGPFAHRLFALSEVLMWLGGRLNERQALSPQRVARTLKRARAPKIKRLALGQEPAGCTAACRLSREEQVFARPDLPDAQTLEGDEIRKIFWDDRSDLRLVDAVLNGEDQ